MTRSKEENKFRSVFEDHDVDIGCRGPLPMSDANDLAQFRDHLRIDPMIDFPISECRAPNSLEGKIDPRNSCSGVISCQVPREWNPSFGLVGWGV